MKIYMNFLDNFGFLIVFVIGFITLLKNPIYLSGYLVFTCINQIINIVLKSTIREPRPITINETNYDKYGMPSGHAQHIYFFMTFTYLVNKSIMVLLLELFISFFTLYQRWKYKKHSIPQLLVGSIIGIIVAFLSVESIKIYLRNK